jgi:arylsulfatase A-like enzyme
LRILYLDLDALTPSHLGCYGYCRNTSPTIDSLAKRGVRCTNVYASDAPCLPSRTAFYSGRFGIQTGVVGHGGTAAQPKIQGPDRDFRDHFDNHGLARQLQHAGYHTAMISPFGQRHAAWHFYAGFNEIHNTGGGGSEPAEVVMPVVDKWLDDNAAKDQWYLHVNFWDIHTNYRTPLDYGEPFESDPLPDWMTQEMLDRHVKKTGPHSALDVGMWKDGDQEKFPRTVDRIDSMENLKKWINGYDTAIRYVDDKIAEMLAKLEAAGVLDDTMIVVSADHGENQGELGIYGEHGTADQGTCNIPMIVAGPGIKKGVVDDGLHYNIDFTPTLMDLHGREKHEIWDGESYAKTLQTGENQGRSEVIISQCAHVCQRSVRFDVDGHKWLYMRTYHDGCHLFPDHMLFDLAADPHEQNEISADHPEVVREGAFRLSEWHAKQMHKMPQDKVDPLWTVIEEGGPYHANTGEPRGSLYHSGGLDSYIERLEVTGRSDGAAALRKQYADVSN